MTCTCFVHFSSSLNRNSLGNSTEIYEVGMLCIRFANRNRDFRNHGECDGAGGKQQHSLAYMLRIHAHALHFP